MTHRDDPLWTGERGDAELQALEALLRPLAHAGRPLPLDSLPVPRPAPRRRRVSVALALVAAALLALPWLLWPAPPLAPGAAPRAYAATTQPLRIELGALAEITLAPGSRLHFEHWRDDEALFRLEAGSLEARVAQPPAVLAGFFRVATPHGRVVDQGCRYQLALADDGSVSVRVTEGAVTFEFPSRTVFVPAGASVRVAADGPGLPLFLDSDFELRKATKWFATLRSEGAGASLVEGAKAIAGACRTDRDSLVLWHLLAEPDLTVREIAERSLTALVGSPEPTQKGGPDHWPAETWLPFLRQRAWSQGR